MNRHSYDVFSRGSIGSMTLPNRIVRSATYSRNWLSIPNDIIAIYSKLAKGGTGLIITGDAGIIAGDGTPAPESGIKGIYAHSDYAIPGISRIADIVHQTAPECKVAVQLSAQGYAPSDLSTPALKWRGLSAAEIRKVIDIHVATTCRMKEAGFDAVQIHAGHGHTLFWAFLSPYANHRADEYGGSAENRARIVREFVSEAREKVGDFPLLIKMNCDDSLEGGIDPENFPELAYAVAEAGIDALEISGGSNDCLVRSEEELGFPPMLVAEARTRINVPEQQSYFAESAARLDLDIPVILVGGNRDIERLEGFVKNGTTDFVALCRPLISEPDLPLRLRQGVQDQSRCISANRCWPDEMDEGIACKCRIERG